MLRKLIVPFCLASALLGGCNCNQVKPTLGVSVTAPKNGASLTMKDDVANDVAGLQVNVVAKATNFAQSDLATLYVDGTAWSGGAQALLSDLTVTFSKVTLASGSHVFKVSVNGKDGKAESTPVSVVADDTQVNGSLTILAPVDGAKLNAKSDVSTQPGLQANMEIQSAGLSGGVLRICLVGQGLTGPACKQAQGQAIAEVALSPTNDTKTVITLLDGTNEKLSAEHEASSGSIDAVAAAVTLTVDTTAPSIVFDVPQNGATLSQQQLTMQLEATDAEPGQVVTITSSLATDPIAVPPMPTDGSGRISVPVTLPPGDQTLTAKVADIAGNEGTASITVTVNVVGCDVVLTDPSTAAFAFNIANANPSGTPLVGKYTLKGKTTKCQLGTARITKTLNGQTSDLGTASVDAAGLFSFEASFTDGEADAVVTVKIEKTGVQANDGIDLQYMADFTPPTLVDAIPALGNLFVVNPANPHVTKTPPDQGYVADADGSAAGGQVDVVLTVSGAGTIATTGFGSTLTGTVTVTAGASQPINQSISTNAQQTVPQRITLAEGFTGPVTIGLKDAAGNTATGVWNANISTTTPTISVVAPTFTVCNVAHQKVPSGAGTCDVDFTVLVGANATRVDFTVNPAGAVITPTSVTTFTNNHATATYALPQSTTPITMTATVWDAVGGSAKVDYVITLVDNIAPTLSFLSPAPNTTEYDQNFDVSLATDAEAGQTITVDSSAQTGEVGHGTVVANYTGGNPNGAGFAVNVPAASQTLSATVTDAAGNTSAAATVAIQVSLVGCNVLLTDPSTTPFIFNIANSAPAAGVGHYTIKGSTTNCASGTVHFLKNAVEVATSAVDASGNFAYSLALNDGEANATLTVKITKTGVLANNGVDLAYMADFTAPTLDNAIPALGNLFVIYAANPHAGQAGYVVDADAAAAGGQVDVNLTVTGIGTIASTGNGSIVVTAGGTDLINQTQTNNGTQTVSQRVTLTEGFSGPVTITLKDSAGNSATGTWNAAVSTIPIPTLTIVNPPAGTINVMKDQGGDRSTYALVQGVVTFSSAAPAGAQIVMCSTFQTGSAPTCGAAGYFELPGTRQGATGTSQFYSALHLAQGTQDILAEMVDSVGGLVDSAPVHFVVDTKPPQVLTVVASDDNSPKDGIISGTELPTGNAASFAVTFNGVEDNQQATLHEGSSTIATAAVTGNATTFSVATLSDGPHTYKVLVSDKAGNPNESILVSPAITNPADTLLFSVQRVAPSISRVAPTVNICNGLNDADKSSPGTCEVDFRVLVGGSATRVDYSLLPASAGAVTPASVLAASFAGNTATARFSLQQTTSTVTLVAAVFDAAGNSRQATYDIILVDTIPPTLTIVSPAPPSATEFTQVFPFSVTTDAENGQEVIVTSLVAGNPEVGHGTVTSGAATFNVSLTGTSQTLSAIVTDVAGNPSVAKTVDIQLNLSGCDVNFTNPTSSNPIFNATNAPGGLVHIAGYSTIAGCDNKQVDFSVTVGGVTTSVGSATTNGSMQFTFDYTFADGSLTIFTAKSAVAGSTANSFTAITDITPPTLQVTAPAPDGLSKLFVVAKNGNIYVKSATAGYVPDLDDTTAGGQVLFAMSESGAGPSASTGKGKVQILQGAKVVFEQQFSDNTSQALAPAVTLDQAFVGSLQILAADYAGNTASQTWSLTVDVVPPPSPAFVTDSTAPKYTHVVNERHADMDVYWTTPADDGPTGQILTWDLGYTTSYVLGATPFDDAAYDNPALVTKIAGLGTVGVTGSVAGRQLTNLPPLNTFLLAPRLVDGVGNRSPLAPSVMPVLWHSVTIPYSGATTSPSFGLTLATGGDVDKDGFLDVVVGAETDTVGGKANAGSITVLFGGTTMPPTRSQTIGGSAANGFLGATLALGDVSGDGRSDLVAYASGTQQLFIARSSPVGYASVPDFTFSGANLSSALILKDITGDGIDELVLGASSFNSKGAVYIFFGRANWSSIAVAGVIDVSKADRTILGTDANGYFGDGAGMVVLPPIGGDPVPELVVPAPGTQKLYVFHGNYLSTAPATINATVAGQILTLSGSHPNFFPVPCAVLDLNGDGLVDMTCGDQLANALYLLPQQSGGSFQMPSPASIWTSGPSAFPNSLAAGDLNGDGKADLCASSVQWTGSYLGQARIYFSGTGGVSAAVGSAISGGSEFGYAMGVADINGDGSPDLIIGDTQGNGNVTIYY